MPENVPFTAPWCADIAEEVVKAFGAKFPKEVDPLLDEGANTDLYKELIVETYRQILLWHHSDDMQARNRRDREEEMKAYRAANEVNARALGAMEKFAGVILKDMGIKPGVTLTAEQQAQLKEKLEKMGESPLGDGT